MSLTVTVKLQLDELPAASVAVACTVVVPTGKLDPDAWSVTIKGTEQLSLPLTANVTGAAQVPAIAFATMFGGQLIVGGVLSITVMVCEALVIKPALSFAVKVRVITSGLAIDPAPLFVSETVTVGAPQLSDAVA
jgi:hypothetical protein